MGRKIRRVPPNWEHPKDKDGKYIPMFDRTFEEEAREWLDNCIAWDNGTHTDFTEHPERKKEYPFYWQWDGNPPDPESYRPAFTEEYTWYQVYETVSEGTPITPPFETKEELIDYLINVGDFWGYKWDKEAAESFAEREWSFSMMGKVGVGLFTPNKKEMWNWE